MMTNFAPLILLVVQLLALAPALAQYRAPSAPLRFDPLDSTRALLTWREPQRAIAGGQLGINGQPTRFHLQEQFLP